MIFWAPKRGSSIQTRGASHCLHIRRRCVTHYRAFDVNMLTLAAKIKTIHRVSLLPKSFGGHLAEDVVLRTEFFSTLERHVVNGQKVLNRNFLAPKKFKERESRDLSSWQSLLRNQLHTQAI